jgi:hypothetical protein
MQHEIASQETTHGGSFHSSDFFESCLIKKCQALAAIPRDYTAVTGSKNAYRPADAVLRPLMLAINSITLTLLASPNQVC